MKNTKIKEVKEEIEHKCYGSRVREGIVFHCDICDAVLPKSKQQEKKCRICGCTENKACAGGCSWIEYDLCSACLSPTKEEEFWQEDIELLPELTEDIPDPKFKTHFSSRSLKE